MLAGAARRSPSAVLGIFRAARSGTEKSTTSYGNIRIAMHFDFDAIFYYVSDLDRAIDFYQNVLGFNFISRDAVARFEVGGVLFEIVPTRDTSKLRGNGNGESA